MRTWAMRIVGLLNILFAIFGLLIEVTTLWFGWGRWPGSATPVDWAIFALLLAISVYLVVHPAIYGIGLVKKDESALLPCAVLFAAQMLTFLGVWILFFALGRSMPEIVSGLWCFAILSIQYSVLYGYSTLGLIVTITLLLLRRVAAKGSRRVA